MQTAAVVLTIIGTVGVLVSSISLIVLGSAGLAVLVLLGIILGLISLITCISLCKSVADEEKSTGIGVMALLFCGTIGGILYLCWNDQASSSYHSDVTTQYQRSNNTYTGYTPAVSAPIQQYSTYSASASEKLTSESADELIAYKKLLDAGIITEEDFNKKKESIMTQVNETDNSVDETDFRAQLEYALKYETEDGRRAYIKRLYYASDSTRNQHELLKIFLSEQNIGSAIADYLNGGNPATLKYQTAVQQALERNQTNAENADDNLKEIEFCNNLKYSLSFPNDARMRLFLENLHSSMADSEQERILSAMLSSPNLRREVVEHLQSKKNLEA